MVEHRGQHASSEARSSLPRLPRSGTLPLPVHSLLLSTELRMREAGGRERGRGEGGEPPDRSTKTSSGPYSLGPPAKDNANARYTTSSQTVVNRRALLMDRTGSLKKHAALQSGSKMDA